MAGSILPWAVVHFERRFLGIDLGRLAGATHQVRGTDLTDGVVTMSIAIAVALGGIAGLVATGRRLRVACGVFGLTGGLTLAGVGVYELLAVAEATRDAYNPFRGFGRLHVRQPLHVTTSIGVPLLIAGGVVAAAGSAVVLVRALRARAA
jgi:hypothetical protein